MSQVASSQFSATCLGHMFLLRQPVSKITVDKCGECGSKIWDHCYSEVAPEDALMVMTVKADNVPSQIVDSCAVGSFKAALSAAKKDPKVVVLNTAGHSIERTQPLQKQKFDELRASGRMLDFEWEDADSFSIPINDVIYGIQWIDENIRKGKTVVINCYQGRSRSGTMAVAYIMASLHLGVNEALVLVKSRRPIVQPNPTFMKFLKAHEAEIKGALDGLSGGEIALRWILGTQTEVA